MDQNALQAIIAELLTRGGHEKVRSHLHRLLTEGLRADSTAIDFERRVPEVRGRIDALLGRTVFEIKSDLRRELRDAEAQLASYLPDRERETGDRFVGIATDGTEFRVYMMRDSALDLLGTFRPKVDEPRGLLGWLESVVLLNEELPPDVESIRQELGRDSIHYSRALREIEALWRRLEGHSEASVKRDLWNRLLSVAYGSEIDAPGLFFQHTYLTIVAKAIATVALLDTMPASGADLLEGKPFRDLSIVGAVEGDFFDWILLLPEGGDLVMEIARHANRFRLRDIEADILKGLYESLIDPEQRHDLGEYYTPDWLAERICETAITDPLEDRVIDPACGSGTFLFHAIRRLVAAAESAGRPAAETVALASEKVAGIDIHPVAVIFARATYLLALMPTLQRGRPPSLNVPVYLGDSLQWNAREFMNAKDLEIVVPAEGETARGKFPDEVGSKRVILRFPVSVAAEPALFDATLDQMLDMAGRDQPIAALEGWLARQSISAGPERDMLIETYMAFIRLQKEGRNHIWGYVARNLSRPIWLASDRQKADVVVGNPPWHAYARMSATIKKRFKEEMTGAGLWGGLTSVSGFDLSSYFFVRSVYLYMRKSGRIAFVMPYASMFKKPYAKFRRGTIKARGHVDAQVQFTDAWAFPSDVQPLFPVPSCVLFAERTQVPRPLPGRITRFSGHLPRRDARMREASTALTMQTVSWPTTDSSEGGSVYRQRFRNGAVLWPRRFVLVEHVATGRLAASATTPFVRGRVTNLDKKPWNQVPPVEGRIESQFLREVFLGESIAPFRVLHSALAVLPIDPADFQLLDSEAAYKRGASHLGLWLSTVEDVWGTSSKQARSFSQQLDFFGNLTGQFPLAHLRIIYSKAGTQPCAAILKGDLGVIENALYWMAISNVNEGRYLAGVLNSEAARQRAEKWQAQGQWGARHFDKVMFNLPIPLFDPKSTLHRDLAGAAERSEAVAARVEIKEGEYFTRTRRRIREALRADGVADHIDKLVARLLDG